MVLMRLPASMLRPTPIGVGILALCIVSLLICIKLIALNLSGSTAVLASLTDSMMDGIVSLMNFIALRQALKPADKNHRYGHGKIEGLAGLFQGIFMALAALFVLKEALHHLTHPVTINAPETTIGIMVISILLTLGLTWLQGRSLQNTDSLAIRADRAHYQGDIFTHIAVIIALLGGMLGAPEWLDPLIAIGITVYLGLMAWHIGKKGVDILLDRELSGDAREKILTTILMHQDIKGVHDLRTRSSGMRLHISFDVEIDPDMTLCRAHKVAKQVEEELLKDFPNAEIMIHKDPVGDTDDSRHNPEISNA